MEILMVTLVVRITVGDYGKWRPFFDEDKARRRESGATGVEVVYRDVNDPNVITMLLEWDNVENAKRFAESPALAEIMQKAGVIGRPSLVTIMSRP
jgi:hypothetical protein